MHICVSPRAVSLSSLALVFCCVSLVTVRLPWVGRAAALDDAKLVAMPKEGSAEAKFGIWSRILEETYGRGEQKPR